MASNWKIIRPEATTNLVTNPSFETGVANWTFSQSGTGGSATQSSVTSYFGLYSAAILASSTGNAILRNSASFAETLGVGETVTITAYAYADTAAADAQISVYDETNTTIRATSVAIVANEWERIEVSWTNNTAGAVGLRVYLYNTGGGTGSIVYYDGVQAEYKTYATTYCDGTQPGCTWTGTLHASTSTRDALEPSGGRLLDFADDLSFHVAAQDGTGMPPVTNLSSPLAFRPGELFEAQYIESRSMTLRGTIVGSTPENFHSKKQSLISALLPTTVKISERAKPRHLRYTGASVDKEIKAVYDGGLEGGLPQGWTEADISLRMKADDPLFYGLKDDGVASIAATLTALSATGMAKRTSTGAWSVLASQSGATFTDVQTIIEDDNYVYIGGNFTNWNSIANADYIVRYSKSAGTWSAMGTGANGIVYSFAIDKSGNLWAGGAFTAMGGVANTDGVAYWNGSSWNAAGTGVSAGTGEVYALHSATDGYLYAGGDFTGMGGVANTAYVARWTGSAWQAVSSGLNGIVYSIKSNSLGVVYVGGAFTNADGDADADYVAQFTGSSFSSVGAPYYTTCSDLAIDKNNLLYASSIGPSAPYLQVWNGSEWNNLGDGINNACYKLALDSSGGLYAVGGMTQAGTIEVDGIAKWNGTAWVNVDFHFGLIGSAIYTVYINKNDELYIGGTFQDPYASEQITVTYEGTAPAYPIIKITHNTTADCNLYYIKNETTGATLYFDISIANGETITIDCAPSSQSITSSLYGDLFAKLLPGSDFGQFFLMPGNSGSFSNSISVFVWDAGVLTGTADSDVFITYKTAYISED